MENVEAQNPNIVNWSYASPWRRLGAYLFDMAFLLGSISTLGILYITVVPTYIEPYQIFGLSHKLAALELERDVYSQAIRISIILILLIIFMTPIFFSLSRWRGTLGMMIMNCQVIAKNFQPLSFKKAFLRFFLRWLPIFLQILILEEGNNTNMLEAGMNSYHLLPLLGFIFTLLPLLGFIFIFFNQKRQALHDYIVGTCVVHNFPEMPLINSLKNEFKTEDLPNQDWSYAHPLRRLNAFLIDSILMIIGFIFIIIFTSLTFISLILDPQSSKNNFNLPIEMSSFLYSWIGLLICTLLILYFFIIPLYFISSRGHATPGMRLMGTRVFTENLENLSFKKSLYRHILRWIPPFLMTLLIVLVILFTPYPINWNYIFILYCILFAIWLIPLFFNKKRQTFYDYLTGTYVVYNLPKMPFRKSKNIVIETKSA